ncbi:MAG: hypothetical protein GF355_10690 [Candidatus Eisenbacteria bacterium]|nr:hypothetical protein [Candidatus Eisenbacteria bacterium]
MRTPRERVLHLIPILESEHKLLEEFLDRAQRIQEALLSADPARLLPILDEQAQCLERLRNADSDRAATVAGLAKLLELPGDTVTLDQLLPHVDSELRPRLEEISGACREAARRVSRIQRINAILAEKSLHCVEGLGRSLVAAIVEGPDYGPAGRRPASAPPAVLDRRA